jgi:hypothetical protein
MFLFKENMAARSTEIPVPTFVQGVQIKSGPYFNMSNLFTKIYYMLYYITNLYLQ